MLRIGTDGGCGVLEATVDCPRGAAHLAHLGRALSPERRPAQGQGPPRRASWALFVHFILSPDRGSSTQGKLTFYITLNHPTKDEPRTDFALGSDGWCKRRGRRRSVFHLTLLNATLTLHVTQIYLPTYLCTSSHRRLHHAVP